MNWKEIPEIMNFCNRGKAKIKFHEIIFPPHLALWNLSPSELNEIYGFLSSQIPNANNYIEKKNSEQFKSFLEQIKVYYTNSLLLNGSHVEDVIEMKEEHLEEFLLSSLFNEISKNKNSCQSNAVKNLVHKLKDILLQIDTYEQNEARKRALVTLIKLPTNASLSVLFDNPNGLLKVSFMEYILTRKMN